MDPAALAFFAAVNRRSLEIHSLEEIEKYTKVLNLATASFLFDSLLKNAILIATTEKEKMNDGKSASLETLLTIKVTVQLEDLLKTGRRGVSVDNEWQVKSEKEEKSGALDITFCDKEDFAQYQVL
jgi:hypothetical protein